ncbi:substrate-binding domain-containing protein [Nocardioides humi]|uniref:Periplasmic binding protein domain-containing protein n=1 Tax=Nocardioides humi TaxID=449461 RepID=A0ABN2BZ31_9ACTN|nr:substrate-binding domain-containing protein [Nocardioides humi]
MLTARTRSDRATLLLAAAALLGSAAVACSSTDQGDARRAGAELSEVEGAQAGDIGVFCPDEPTKVQFIKSRGGDVYSTISGAEFEAEAAKCDTLDASWVNVTSGVQGAISATNAAIAQGVQVLVVQPDFGASQLPAMRAAMDAGVSVVSVLAGTDGVKGQDFVEQVVWSDESIVEKQARWLADNIGSGRIAYLGGPGGVVSSERLFAALEHEMAEVAPDIEIASGDWIATDWDPGKKRQITSGLVAKYGRIDAVVSDYAATDTGAVQGFLDAGGPMPAFLNIASSQAFVCLARDNDVRWFGQDGTTGMAAVALRVGLAAHEGHRSPEELPVRLSVYADTVAGIDPVCDTSLPPDADLSSALSVAELQELLK